jgi:hypothetical protein
MASGWGGWPCCPLNIARWVVLKRDFAGWRAAVFTGKPACGRHLGLRAHKVHKLYNGALLCELFILNCTDHRKTKSPPLGGCWRRSHVQKPYAQESAASTPLGCARGYRLLPSLRCRSAGNNLAIDLYQNGARWLQVQEYEAPVTVDQRRARSRLNNALAVIPPILAVPLEHVFLNQQRRSGASMRDLARAATFMRCARAAIDFWSTSQITLIRACFLISAPLSTRRRMARVRPRRSICPAPIWTERAIIRPSTL